MRAFRVVQISDTHLGRQRSWFVANFQSMARIISVRQPDLVINTGDVSFDGDLDEFLEAYSAAA
jgi:3',5'-cyclic AMP phosphodiesterase CpdA